MEILSSCLPGQNTLHSTLMTSLAHSLGLAMPPRRCCLCNGSGRCKNCSCVRNGTPCIDCYVGEERFQNRTLPGASRILLQPVPVLAHSSQTGTSSSLSSTQPPGGTSGRQRATIGCATQDNMPWTVRTEGENCIAHGASSGLSHTRTIPDRTSHSTVSDSSTRPGSALAGSPFSCSPPSLSSRKRQGR